MRPSSFTWQSASEDFRVFWSGRSLQIEEIEPSEAEQRHFIDIRPFSNQSTRLVPENMTLLGRLKR